MMEVPHLMISLTFPVAAFTSQTVYSNSSSLHAGPEPGTKGVAAFLEERNAKI